MELFLFICAFIVIAIICDKLSEPGIKKRQAEEFERLLNQSKEEREKMLRIEKENEEWRRNAFPKFVNKIAIIGFIILCILAFGQVFLR